MKTAYLYNPLFLKHDLSSHSETAKRLLAIIGYLQKHNLLRGLQHFEGRKATREELLLCHTPAMIDRCRDVQIDQIAYLDSDTYMTPASYEAALTAAGGLIQMVESLLQGEIANGFAFCRPPGHHATPYKSMGFCLFNSVAIAARYAIKIKKLERVAIVDYDVHHGNGTEAIFESDPQVLYVSSHGSPLYPGTGQAQETGRGLAKGTLCNIPLPAYSGDAVFHEVYNQVALPVIRRFQPQLILVSAGFDAHFTDPLANLGLSHTGFQWLNRQLCELADELCGGRILFSLEGGYNLEVLGPVIGNLLRSLCGHHDFDDPYGKPAFEEPDVRDLISKLKILHHLG